MSFNKKIKQLQEKRADQVAIMTALNKKAEDEKRSFSEEEQSSFDAAAAEIEKLNREIKNEEVMEQARSYNAQPIPGDGAEIGEKNEKNKIRRRYSFIRAMRHIVQGAPLEGLEKEMHEEAQKEARSGNRILEGVGVPHFFFMSNEERAQSVGNNNEGGYTVATELGEVIPYLEPRMAVRELGATYLTGLQGNVKLPRVSAVTTAEWEGEADENAETQLTFDEVDLAPHRLGSKVPINKQLLIQSSAAIENMIRRDMERSIGKKVEGAALNGSGIGNVPLGLLNLVGIGNVEGGTNGAIPTYPNIVKLQTLVSEADADMGRLGYLTTPGLRGTLKTEKLDAGSGRFLWAENSNELNGTMAAVSTLVPSGLTKGTSNDCHALIYGNWEELLIAQWGPIDMVIDPYTLAGQSRIRIVVNTWWDIDVRHIQSFAAMKDARLIA